MDRVPFRLGQGSFQNFRQAFASSPLYPMLRPARMPGLQQTAKTFADETLAL